MLVDKLNKISKNKLDNSKKDFIEKYYKNTLELVTKICIDCARLGKTRAFLLPPCDIEIQSEVDEGTYKLVESEFEYDKTCIVNLTDLYNIKELSNELQKETGLIILCGDVTVTIKWGETSNEDEK